ncbi:hypothetical protein [Thioclava sp. GXIMD4215]|uniref:hypothetical protein n=1 Tax=Thioclava sp. GXIMD4215 TaxID=3131928 RepID=UPI00325640FC
MKQKMREISLILATGVTAVACSQFMQHADTIFAQFGVSPADAAIPHIARPVSETRLVSALGAAQSLGAAPARALGADLPVPTLPQDRLYSASFTTEPAPARQVAPPQGPALELAEASACGEPVLHLEKAENGMISVAYIDACHAGAIATLTQPGLQFDVQLDAQGKWGGLVPAMIANTRLTVASAGGVVSEGINQPDAAQWNRVVLSWTRPVALHLSARDTATDGTPEGYLTRFSSVEDGQQAEVYSTRLDLAKARLAIDAALTKESCDQDLEGNIAWSDQSKLHPMMPVTLMMPECDQLGGAVVMDLPNLAEVGP